MFKNIFSTRDSYFNKFPSPFSAHKKTSTEPPITQFNLVSHDEEPIVDSDPSVLVEEVK